jgi:hypothetical protein
MNEPTYTFEHAEKEIYLSDVRDLDRLEEIIELEYSLYSKQDYKKLMDMIYDRKNRKKYI